MTTTRIRAFAHRHWALLTVSLVAVAAVAVLVTVLAQRPAEGTQPNAETTAPSAAEPVTLNIRVETGSGLIGVNHDDSLCLFPDLEYQLADASGTLVAVGRWEDDGASVGQSEWAAIGQVESTDPYLCRHLGHIDAPAPGIYELTITAGGAQANSVIEGDGRRNIVIELS